MKAVRRPQFWFKLTMWLLSFVIAGLLIQLGGRIMQDIPTAGERISRDDFVNAEQLNKVDAQLGALEKASKGQSETEVDYCVHCGFCLYDKCANCGTRENSFFPFCGSCGMATNTEVTEPATA